LKGGGVPGEVIFAQGCIRSKVEKEIQKGKSDSEKRMDQHLKKKK
jgi:hypothetical protein